jgi:hypothetical protein
MYTHTHAQTVFVLLQLSEQIDEAGMYSTLSPRDRLTKKRQTAKLDVSNIVVFRARSFLSTEIISIGGGGRRRNTIR